MAENELLPKGKTSKEWLSYADSKLKEFKDYHSQRNLLGQIKNAPPLQDDYSKLLSQNELSARKTGMEFLRKERTEEGAATMQKYRQGGRAQKTGPAKLHEGEAVVRKTTRKNTRKNSR